MMVFVMEIYMCTLTAVRGRFLTIFVLFLTPWFPCGFHVVYWSAYCTSITPGSVNVLSGLIERAVAPSYGRARRRAEGADASRGILRSLWFIFFKAHFDERHKEVAVTLSVLLW